MRQAICSLVVAATLVTAANGVAPSTAFAQAGPIRLVSSNGIEQADAAESPALAADGRFVAFRGQIGGQLGIFRKDLVTGEIAPVVIGEPNQEPSISADGRYVSFTTTKPLDLEDDLGAFTSDVYVADLATVPPTYELASAIDGCDPVAPAPHPRPCGLTYESNSGSVATGRMALSADGREVVFVTTSASNLTEPAVTSAPLPTPALQVAVRNLATDETTLISTALGSSGGDAPVEGGAVMSNGVLKPGASISADGSTVAWLGQHLTAQVSLGADEAASIADFEGMEGYDEPLLRRVPAPGAGVASATRRLMSGKDFPDMTSGTNYAAAPNCATTLGWNLGGGQAVPALSADGDQVALVGQPDGYTDAFVVDLAASGTVVRRLTSSPRLPGNNACAAATESAFIASNAEIKTIAIAPEGERIAFTTRRQRFTLSPPNLNTPLAVGFGVEELYLVDLGAASLERLTHGSAVTEPSLGEAVGSTGATSVSFDASGESLAFASSAYNLVPADGNGAGNGLIFGGSGSDVFMVNDPRATQAPGTTRISSPPPAIRPRGRWALTAHASSRPDGSVRVAVGVPGAGNLAAVARAKTTPGKHVRKVAAARRKARLASVLIFILHPARGLRRQVRAKGGLEASLRLHFVGKGGEPLTARFDVRFRVSRDGKKGHAK
jgi:hypothetical protein